MFIISRRLTMFGFLTVVAVFGAIVSLAIVAARMNDGE